MNPSNFPERATIEQEQLTTLNQMLMALVPNNRFYTPRLREAGLERGVASLQEFFAKMPFTHKIELVEDQAHSPPYGTNLTYPLAAYTRFCQTSGTTGQPLRWLDTPESWSWMVDTWVEVLQAAQVTSEDRIYCAFSFGPFLGFWTAFEAGAKMGCLSLPGGGLSSSARLRALLDNRATVLCCTPTYAIRLGEEAIEEGILLAESAVRAIMVAGEPGAGIPATRARIEQLWPGARVYDHHGMTETGPVSLPCPQCVGVLHIREAAYIPEVIDPESGIPVGPGETGELVLTNLGRVGSPLLRYRTGDLVKRCEGAVCECRRRDMALEGGIVGRTDDMVVVRGVNIHPSAVEAVLRRFDRIAEYRVELRTERAMQEIALFIEPLPNCADTAALVQEVEAALRSVFSLRVPVLLAPVASLPRFELKARRWIRTGA